MKIYFLSFHTIYRSFTKLGSGKELVKDVLYSRRPTSVDTKSNSNKTKSSIEKDAHFTDTQLEKNDKIGLIMCLLHSEENS